MGCFSFGEFSWFGLFGLCFSFLFSLCFCFCLVVLFVLVLFLGFCFVLFIFSFVYYAIPNVVEFPGKTCIHFVFTYPIPTSWSAILSMRTGLFWLWIFVLDDLWWSRWGDFLLPQTDLKRSLPTVQGRLWKKLHEPQTSWKDSEGYVPAAIEHIQS